MSYVGFVMAQIATDFRISMVRAVLNASWSYFISQPLGRFTNAVTNESSQSAAVYMNICQFIACILQVLVYFAAAMLVSWVLTVGAIAAGLFMWLILGYFVGLARRAGQEQAKITKSLSTRIADSLQSIKPLKAMREEERVLSLLKKDAEELKNAQRMQVLSKHFLSTMREPIIVIFLAVGLYASFDYLTIGVASLLTMAVLFHRLVNALGGLQQFYQLTVSSEPFFWSLQEIITTAENADENLAKGNAPQFEKEIKFENITLKYGAKTVLDEVDFSIPVGKLIALTGPSGGGKTTIVDLVCGLLTPDNGKITLDGNSLSETSLAEWRKNIGYVPQDVILFHENIYTNVTLGNEKYSHEDVENALKHAGAWRFINELPEKLDTIVGERGVKFSGGQRQRIAIARALVRKPKLLVLYEATTALDPETEAAICDTICSLAPDVTVFAISHQPAITKVADRTYYLENGKIKNNPAN